MRMSQDGGSLNSTLSGGAERLNSSGGIGSSGGITPRTRGDAERRGALADGLY